MTVQRKLVRKGYEVERVVKQYFAVSPERDLRERFLEIWRQQDRPAAQVTREFMRAVYSCPNGLILSSSRTKALRQGALPSLLHQAPWKSM